MKTKTHFAFRVDIWDDTGNTIVEHVAGVDDFDVAEATYRAAVARWPAARITLRHGIRVVHDTAVLLPICPVCHRAGYPASKIFPAIAYLEMGGVWLGRSSTAHILAHADSTSCADHETYHHETNAPSPLSALQGNNNDVVLKTFSSRSSFVLASEPSSRGWRVLVFSPGGDGGRRSPELLTAQPAQVVCGSQRLPNNRYL
jgi:hypothetical protein